MVQVTLNSFELQMLVLAADRRNFCKQHSGVTNRKVDGKQSDFSIHLHGIAGEYAVSKLLGIKIDTSVSLSGDDKVSDLTFNGKTIQVKTTIGYKNNPHLFFKSLDLFKADITVLTMIPNLTDIHVLGWVTREQFRVMSEPWQTSYGTVPAMEASKLEKTEYLKSYLETI